MSQDSGGHGGDSKGCLESMQQFHEAAIEAVGYDDFGDPGYLDGLQVLLGAYDDEAKFNDYGRKRQSSVT